MCRYAGHTPYVHELRRAARRGVAWRARRNLRPYFKFTLPTLDLNPDEARAWEGLRTGSMTIAEVRAARVLRV